jgi:Ca-activated chloride channel family protein
MERIRFENPALLHLLWLLLLQAILLWYYWRWRKRTLKSIGSPRLERRLLLGFSVERFWLKNGVFSLVLLLLILAIANPQKMVRLAPSNVGKSDIIIALDVSRSMLAMDVEPSRLVKAQDYVKQLIKLQGHNRLGLVFFAGDAFPQSPLTNDPTAILLFLSNASPDAINSQGTSFNAAILQALRLFPTDSTVGKAIVIVSDGESHTEADLEAAVLAKKEGVVIHTVSVGTVGGSSIPVLSGRLLRDFDGNIVRTALQERSLELISKETNGYYSRIDDQNGIKRIEGALDNLQKVHVEQQSIFVYFSYYQWLLFLVIVLLVIDQLLFWKQKTTF